MWCTLAIVVGIGYLTRHPIRLSNSDDQGQGHAREGAEQADVLILVWSSEIVRSAGNERFDEIDWSWLWVDLFQSELGPVRIAEPDELDQSLLDEVRVVVVTQSAAVHPAVQDSVHDLERFVTQGGTLVMERPQGSLREAFSADGLGGMRTPRSITFVDGASGRYGSAFEEIPLFTRYVGSTGPLHDAETLLAMDGAPVVYRLQRALGAAITVDFNFGLALISLQQGRPSNQGFSVEAARDGVGPTVADLVAHSSLLQAEIPLADLLKHFMVHIVVGETSPLPGYWFFPGGCDGVLLLSHEVTQEGANATWMVEYEIEQDSTSTVLVGYSATPSPGSINNMVSNGAGLAVLWERGSLPSGNNRQRVGVGGLTPFYREANLAQQRQRLQEAPVGTPILGVRTSNGSWSEDFFEPFQVMASSTFLYDSSYGPVPSESEPAVAYRHGTGRPFLVYDSNGLPFGLYEVPVTTRSLARARGVERLLELMDESEENEHQAFSVQVHSTILLEEGGLQQYDSWQHVINAADNRNHDVISTESLVEFHVARTRSDLQSEIHTDDDIRGNDQPFELVVRANPELPDMWIRVPLNAGERRFRDVTDVRHRDEDGDDSPQEPITRQIVAFGQEIVLISLAEGENELVLTYR